MCTFIINKNVKCQSCKHKHTNIVITSSVFKSNKIYEIGDLIDGLRFNYEWYEKIICEKCLKGLGVAHLYAKEGFFIGETKYTIKNKLLIQIIRERLEKQQK